MCLAILNTANSHGLEMSSIKRSAIQGRLYIDPCFIIHKRRATKDIHVQHTFPDFSSESRFSGLTISHINVHSRRLNVASRYNHLF